MLFQSRCTVEEVLFVELSWLIMFSSPDYIPQSSIISEENIDAVIDTLTSCLNLCKNEYKEKGEKCLGIYYNSDKKVNRFTADRFFCIVWGMLKKIIVSIFVKMLKHT